jgi:capsular polysaccharide biosynthesis protein
MPFGLTRSALLRRLWIIQASVLGVVLVASLVPRLVPPTAVAKAVLLVSSAASERGPGAATEATRLARTYAAALPDDDVVLNVAAARLGWSRKAVADSLEVTTDADTAVLHLTFRADDERQARAGIETMVGALTGEAPRARVGPSGALVLVQAPRVEPAGRGVGAVLPVGIVLGLCLGVVMAIALERADPRIETVEALAEAVGAEASSLDGLSLGATASLLERWSALTDRPLPVIALLAAVPPIEPAMPAIVARLRTLARQGAELYGEDDDARDERLTLVAGGVPGGPGGGERVAAAADGVVLVAPREARRADIVVTVTTLRQLTGKPPLWALMVWRRPDATNVDIMEPPPEHPTPPSHRTRLTRLRR